MNKNKKPRHYKRITPAVIAITKARAASKGNGTAAIRDFDDDYLAPHDRAYRILKKADGSNTLQYIDDSLQQIGAEAVQELGELVHSEDEAIRTRNVHYVIDHLKGKAVQKSVNLSTKVNIQSVLD